MTERPIIVESRNSTVPVILALIAAGVIAFALWFFVIDSDNEADGVGPEITVTTVAG